MLIHTLKKKAMKLNINNTKDSEIIARYLSGEMSNDELTRFEKDIESFPENKNLITEMKQHWNKMGQYKEKREVDANKGWQTLFDRLDTEDLIPETKVVEHKLIPVWAKYAASIIVLLTVASLSVYTVFRNDTSLISLNTGIEPNTLIQTLNDGSVIYLANNTQFSYPQEFGSKERKVNLNGEAYFDIAPNPKKPFRIETDKVIVEVLGTAFNVKSDNNEPFELVVDHGKVRVTLKSDPSQTIIVLPGERISASNSHLVKSKNTDANYFAWKTKQMQFKDESLSNIINVINKNYKSNIKLYDNQLAERKLTVTFYNNSISKVTELICLSLNLKKEVQSDSTIIIKPIEK